uniref:Putative 8.9 kDa secreted protein n=1 Tax=Ixodes ricinus TaxID=34613 RepID=V5H119_IXORI
MKFSSPLFFGLVAVFTAWSLADAYVARAKAENRDGKCFFNNVTIEHGNAYLSENPCESWRCDATTLDITIFGCGVVGVGERLDKVRIPGVMEVYPGCCPQLTCEVKEDSREAALGANTKQVLPKRRAMINTKETN